jgi:hypothetical protein
MHCFVRVHVLRHAEGPTGDCGLNRANPERAHSAAKAALEVIWRHAVRKRTMPRQRHDESVASRTSSIYVTHLRVPDTHLPQTPLPDVTPRRVPEGSRHPLSPRLLSRRVPDTHFPPDSSPGCHSSGFQTATLPPLSPRILSRMSLLVPRFNLQALWHRGSRGSRHPLSPRLLSRRVPDTHSPPESSPGCHSSCPDLTYTLYGIEGRVSSGIDDNFTDRTAKNRELLIMSRHDCIGDADQGRRPAVNPNEQTSSVENPTFDALCRMLRRPA